MPGLSQLEVMLETMLRRDEAQRLKVYDDATGKELVPGMTLVGHPTVGVGRALDRKGISKGESDYLLYGDVLDVQAQARGFPWYPTLSTERQAVLLSMLFQLGLAGVQGFPKMLAALEAQQWAQAAAEMRDSKWAREDSPGRAERLAKQMETGVYQT